jgi:hypothetical protein
MRGNWRRELAPFVVGISVGRPRQTVWWNAWRAYARGVPLP